MNVLVDTNVLLRAAIPGHPQFQSAVDAADLLRGRGDRLVIVPQVLYEFWVVCTRRVEENGLGMTVEEAKTELRRLQGLYRLLPDDPGLFHEWERLVGEIGVSGKSAHDARLAAAMTLLGIEAILTFNARDFIRYPGIVVLAPTDILPTGAL